MLKTEKPRHYGTDNPGRPQAPKEVDSVNSIQTRKTAIQMTSAPSTFGMPFGVPACGHASTGVIAGTDAVRVKGDMGLAVRTYPGTSAWSPPPS